MPGLQVREQSGPEYPGGQRQAPERAAQVLLELADPSQAGHVSLHLLPKNPLGQPSSQAGPRCPRPHSHLPACWLQEAAPQWHCSAQEAPHCPAGHWESHRSPCFPARHRHRPVSWSQPSEFCSTQSQVFKHSRPKVPSGQGLPQVRPVYPELQVHFPGGQGEETDQRWTSYYL